MLSLSDLILDCDWLLESCRNLARRCVVDRTTCQYIIARAVSAREMNVSRVGIQQEIIYAVSKRGCLWVWILRQMNGLFVKVIVSQDVGIPIVCWYPNALMLD